MDVLTALAGSCAELILACAAPHPVLELTQPLGQGALFKK